MLGGSSLRLLGGVSMSNSTSPVEKPRHKRKLSKMANIYSQNRHSIASTGQGSPVDAPSTDPPSSRPSHTRASSLLNFSFRNRTNSNSQQQQQQQALTTVRENGGSMEPAAMTTNEFGRLSMSNSPQQQQQQQPQSKPPATGSLNNNNAPLPNPNQQQPPAASPGNSFNYPALHRPCPQGLLLRTACQTRRASN